MAQPDAALLQDLCSRFILNVPAEELRWRAVMLAQHHSCPRLHGPGCAVRHCDSTEHEPRM